MGNRTLQTRSSEGQQDPHQTHHWGVLCAGLCPGFHFAVIQEAESGRQIGVRG